MNKILSYGIIIFINCIFCLKYSERITQYSILLTAIYFLIQVGLFLFLENKSTTPLIHKTTLAILFITPIVASIISYFYIVPENLNVDRWSVIETFLDVAHNNKYPYYAKSNAGNPPGPMPIYFLIALPFYYFRGYAFLSAIGVCLIVWICKKTKKTLSIPVGLILALISPFVIWEIFALSNIITFTAIVAIGLYYLEQSIRFSKSLLVILHLVLLGFLLSTRSVFCLAYIVFFLSLWKTDSINFRRLALYSIVVLISFSITFLPLLLLHPVDFFKMNPFIVQSSFLLPQQLIPFLFMVAIGLGLTAKNEKQRFFYSGFTLFSSILFYFFYLTFKHGFNEAFYNSVIDLSYFLFAVPFLLIGIHSSFESGEKKIKIA